MNFDSLPTEMKSLIFSYLPLRDVYFNVANVCTDWQSLSRDPHTVQHIEIDRHFDSVQIVECLTNYYLAQSLKLTNINSFDWLSEPLSFPRLRRIHFEFCNFQSNVFIEQIAKTFSTITALKVEYGFRYGIDRHSVVISTRKLIELFAKNCHQLEEVKVGILTPITDAEFQTLTNSQGPTMKKLSLSGINLTDSSYLSLRHCPQLLQLCFYTAASGITDSGLQALMGLKHLHKLYLIKAKNVSANAFVRFFKYGSCLDLRYINLKDCGNVTDDAVILLARRYPKLKYLNLGGCIKITDISMQVVIENCSDLKRLLLINNEKVSTHVLPLISSHLRCLTHLSVLGCKMIKDDDIALLQIVRTIPDLWIVFPSGQLFCKERKLKLY